MNNVHLYFRTYNLTQNFLTLTLGHPSFLIHCILNIQKVLFKVVRMRHKLYATEVSSYYQKSGQSPWNHIRALFLWLLSFTLEKIRRADTEG